MKVIICEASWNTKELAICSQFKKFTGSVVGVLIIAYYSWFTAYYYDMPSLMWSVNNGYRKMQLCPHISAIINGGCTFVDRTFGWQESEWIVLTHPEFPKVNTRVYRNNRIYTWDILIGQVHEMWWAKPMQNEEYWWWLRFLDRLF